MSKFALTVEYESGKITRIVDTPDLHVALNEYVEELKKEYKGGKDCRIIPKLLSASITPIWYEQDKGEKKNE